MQERYIWGGKSVLFREVSSVQECPHRERERFHCNAHGYQTGHTKKIAVSLPVKLYNLFLVLQTHHTHTLTHRDGC